MTTLKAKYCASNSSCYITDSFVTCIQEVINAIKQHTSATVLISFNYV